MSNNRRSAVVGAVMMVGILGPSGCDDDGSKGASDGGTVADGGVDSGGPLDAGGDGPPPRPFSLGPGYHPALAIDPAGASYIAWVGPENTTTSLNFCRLPRGAQACAASGKITTPGTSLSRPFVAVSGTTVHVLSYRYGIDPTDLNGIYLFTSRDGGGTFAAGRKVGITEFSAAALGADGNVSVTTHAVTKGLGYQSISLADAAPASATEAVLSTTHPYSGAVGFADGMTPVVVYANLASDVQLRRYLGAGDRNDAASWSPPVELGKLDRMHLAGGPKGLFLLGQVPTGGLHLRRYEAETFTAGAAIPDGTGELAQAELIQDAKGRLHILWPRVEASGVNLYRVFSDDGGVTWTRSTVTTDDAFNSVVAALAADQIGLAAWGTAAAGASQVHAIAVGP